MQVRVTVVSNGMNFFEKAQARASALETLELSGHPEADEIKAAYKKLAFENHPDRGGTDDEFTRINSAYQLLKEDNGFTASDEMRPAPPNTGTTTFRPKSRRTNHVEKSEGPDSEDAQSAYVAPRRLHTAMTSRVFNLKRSERSACRTLLDELPHMAEPDPDEQSLRADIMDVIETSGAPFVPHKNHLPFAIRQSGRRISYMINEKIAEGVNRVAVPTGTFSDRRKAKPTMVRFKSEGSGAGTHEVSAATLAESFPGARSVRLHFGMRQWPDPIEPPKTAFACAS